MVEPIVLSYTGAKQTLEVFAGDYIIECWGAEGQSANGNNGTQLAGCGGRGAYATVKVKLPACTLVYGVGGMPVAVPAHTNDRACGAGGGMAAVAILGAIPDADIPLLVAAGGGGGTETTRGGNLGGPGNGFGGSQGTSGGGWLVRGSDTYKGNSWVSGLAGVTGNAYGGANTNSLFGGAGGGTDDSGGGGGAGYFGGSMGKGNNGGYSYVTSLFSADLVSVTPGIQDGHGKIVITKIVSDYEMSGEYVTTPIDLSSQPNELRIKWSETVTEATSVVVRTGITTSSESPPTNWVAQTNGELISNIPLGSLTGQYLWIKVNLATTLATEAPVFYNLFLEEAQPNLKKLLVTLTDRLKNPQGQIAVTYNPSNGNLTGEQGSYVSEFTQTFTPVLASTPFFNPHDIERVELVSAVPTANLIPIFYTDGFVEERVELTNVTVTAALIDVINLP